MRKRSRHVLCKWAWLVIAAVAFEMLFAATLVLFFLTLPLHDTHIEEESNEKSAYLEKLTFLYKNLGLNGEEIAQRRVLTGLLSNALNAGKTPREERTVRDVEIMQLQGERRKTFEAKILTDSLQASLEYHYVSGTVDFADFELVLSSTQKLDLSSYATKRPRKASVYPKDTPVNNGSKGIHELLHLANITQCEKDSILNRCRRGSVVMDTWTNQTLAFQRWLQRNLTFDLIQTLGTHNSFNDKADGYGDGDFTLDDILEALSDGTWDFVWAQQWFSMTDQLRMGVRHLMLDPVYFWDKMRLCHCGTTFKWFDDVLHFIEKALNITIQFDSSDLGCMPHDRTLVAGLQEIFDWVVAPPNQEEVTMIHINDERYSADWGHIDLIQDPIEQIFGSRLFTPLDKEILFPNRWPTPTELVKLGKRVIVTCTLRCNNTMIFFDMHIPDWDLDTTKYFTAAPKCGGFVPGQFYLVGGESQVVGPIYNGPEQEGLIIKENFPFLMQCPVTVSEMDLASPGLIASSVWTWATGYSYDNVTTTDCAAVDIEMEGRWMVLSCSTRLFHMCQNASNITDITLSSNQSPWGQTQCPQGYTFSLPQTGYVNWNLLILSIKVNITHTWINLPPHKQHKHLHS